jgi:hypothetical protein
MIYNHWLRITNHEIDFDNILFRVCHAEPVVVNHGVVCWPSGCESWWGMLRKWLLIMLCYAEPVVVNHCAMLSQWLSIMVCYSEPVVVNHGVHYLQPLAQYSMPLFTTFGTAQQSMINKHLLSITHHDSHSLSQHYTPSFTTTGSA